MNPEHPISSCSATSKSILPIPNNFIHAWSQPWEKNAG